MSKAGSPTCCSARCTWSRAFPARRPPTWRRWRRSSSPRCSAAAAHPGELSSLLATSSAMSETIPPSLVLITIGSVTPGLSIAALFTGGLLPAFVAALALVIVAWWRSRKRGQGRRRTRAAVDDRRDLAHRTARPQPAVRDPLHGDRGHRHRNRGLDDRRRLHRDARAPRLPRSSIGGGSTRSWSRPCR